jgi:hypothetical protein
MSLPTHPVDGDLQALLNDELSVLHRGAVQQHVDQCAMCRDRLASLAESWEATHELLSLLAPPPLEMSLQTVTIAGGRARVRRAALIAASITLLVAAVASATVGRSYVRAVAARLRALIHPTAPALHHDEAPRSGQAGIAFVPGTLAEIAFDTPQDTGLLLVTFADTDEVSLRARDPVTYRVYPGGLGVHNRGSVASYELVVPRDAPHVRIVIAGRVRFEKVGSQITTAVRADTAGRYVMSVR